MSDLAQHQPSSAPSRSDLRAQADTQILETGSKSNNPAISQAAADIARARQAHEERMDAKLSPNLAASLATLVAILMAVGSWYALVRYPGALGREITGVVCAIGILAFCSYPFFSGHLDQAGFLEVFRWVADHLQQLNPARWFRKDANPTGGSDD